MFKKINIFVLLLISILCVCSLSVTLNATEDNPIYYEKEVKETNSLPTGITHKLISGYSQVTDESLVSKTATEAGYGSSSPLIRNQYYSQQINLLEIPYESEAKIVPWGVIKNGTWSLATVKTMAEDYEENHPGYKVIAAVNGDFFDINATSNYPYTPIGTMYVDENMYKANSGWGILGFNNSGTGDRLVGITSGMSFSSNPYLYVYNDNDEIISEIEIDKVINDVSGVVGENETALYFSEYDSKHAIVPVAVSDGYIVEKAENSVAFSSTQFFGIGTITKIGSSEGLTKNQFAIVTNNASLKELLKENVKIKVQLKNLNSEFANCDAMIGMHDKVVINGEPCYENDGYGNDRLPRTILGTKADGSVVMLTIDGRQAQYGFYGANQEEYVAISQYYGIVNGYQMDGGGSSTMIVLKNGELTICNSPSDSAGASARSDSDCILVVVKVPEIEYDVSATANSLTFTITKNVENIENLYVSVNDKKYQFVNNTVTIDSLESNSNYCYEFFKKENDKFDSIVYQGTTSTQKVVPEINSLSISLVTIDGEWKYKITCDITDDDSAVVASTLVINGKSFRLKDNTFTLPTTCDNIVIAKGWNIKFVYKVADNVGSKTKVYDSLVIIPNNSLVVLNAQNKVMNNLMDSIFE